MLLFQHILSIVKALLSTAEHTVYRKLIFMRS